MTYFKYCGTVYLCNYIGPWSGAPSDEYMINCPECGSFKITKNKYKVTNNSGRLNLSPPDVVCSCGLHLRIIDGEAEVVFPDEVEDE